MITVSNLWKQYDQQQILKGINLEVSRGETIAILGRSGCGKSVLLRIIAGIEQADRGEVWIDGICFSRESKKHRLSILKKMGMLFQNSALFDSLTVEENVAFYWEQHGFHLSQREIKSRVTHSLQEVGLSGIEKIMPAKLSGGMRKRVALARLLCYKPQIIFYDEPTTGLDPITARQIDELILSMKNQLHSTSIVVTHDLSSALHIADRFVLHEEGKISSILDREEFLNSRHPQICRFFDSSPDNRATSTKKSREEHSR